MCVLLAIPFVSVSKPTLITILTLFEVILSGYVPIHQALPLKASLYENVGAVLNNLTDLEGNVCEKPVQTVSNDLSKIGFTFECGRYDAQEFLLRQRRNRAWGSADLGASQYYGRETARTMKALASSHMIAFSSQFNADKIGTGPPNPRTKHHVEAATTIVLELRIVVCV